ncbi:MAG: hypothetical protein ACRD7E_17545, partial [Bryobacteraceae bacterium]
LIPYLQGRSATSPQSVYCYYHRGRLFAVRSEEWKLHFRKKGMGKRGRYKEAVVCDPPELYNLKDDPGESREVSADHPDVVAGLKRIAKEFEDSIVAGRLPPPYWRSVLPSMRSGTRKR